MSHHRFLSLGPGSAAAVIDNAADIGQPNACVFEILLLAQMLTTPKKFGSEIYVEKKQ